MTDPGRRTFLSLALFPIVAAAAPGATYTLSAREGLQIEEAHPSVTIEVPEPGRIEVADAEHGWRVSFGWTEPGREYTEGVALRLAVTGEILDPGEVAFAVRVHARVETPGGDGTIRPDDRPWRSDSRPDLQLGRVEKGEAAGEILMAEHRTIRIVLVLEGGPRGTVAAWTYRREESSSTVADADRPVPADFSGTWSTEFGDLSIVQDGSRATGRYAAPEGTIEGEVAGDVLRFHWTHERTGQRGAGRFVLGPDGRLSGGWNSGEDPDGPAEGDWTGDRRRGTAPVDAAGPAPPEPPAALVLPGGSISGTVLPTPAFGSPEPAAGPTREALQGGQRRVAESESVTIPIHLIGARDLTNLNVEIRYDPSVVRAGEVVAGDLLEGALFEGNAGEDGIVRLAFASREGVSGTGILASVVFRAVGRPGAESPIALTISAAGRSGRRLPEVDVMHGRIRIERPEGVEPGDADGDGRLTERDARSALRMSVGKTPVRSTTDIDGDGRTTSNDAVRILEAAGGK